jgi:hypothetical protein
MRAELIYIKADRLFGFVIRYTYFERATAPMQRRTYWSGVAIRAPNGSALADSTAAKGTELVE